ncbi:hypothetical protein HGRIS_013870 [Hohenbuehelia grisea]|uniref:Uncharacterized protein n=1 Tax=Hohenbuehelia grisea TaxID=104357 RepID=A0ABR3IWW8_9AGAR
MPPRPQSASPGPTGVEDDYEGIYDDRAETHPENNPLVFMDVPGLSDTFESRPQDMTYPGLQALEQDDEPVQGDNEEQIPIEELDECLQLADTPLALRKTLMGNYKRPLHPPNRPGIVPLTPSETRSLQLYVAWHATNCTVKAYPTFAQIVGHATGTPIHSLKSVRKLAFKLTNLHPIRVDICPNNCIAYAGPFEGLSTCPGTLKSREKNSFNSAPRFVAGPCCHPQFRPNFTSLKTQVPFKQMLVVPVMEVIRSMFANATTSRAMRHRDKLMQKALSLAHRAYCDFASGNLQRKLREHGLF